MADVDITAVRSYLLELQDRITRALEAEDGSARFDSREVEGDRGGMSRPRVLNDGAVFERVAVNFSHAVGDTLPPAATARRPELAGRDFAAVSISLIVHPVNPYVPTCHANFRFFIAGQDRADPIWWFGGGYDLTPYYGFDEDAIHWHRAAQEACVAFGEELYPRFKKQCDQYFYLPHRQEPRGIGGLFFDDHDAGGFARSFSLIRSIADRFLPAYLPIVWRRRSQPYGERERDFQLYRRGRYVEFNLVYDRGTRYGLQSGGRIESILASLPPVVHWRYDWEPEPGSPEARLYERYLVPRDWAGVTIGDGG